MRTIFFVPPSIVIQINKKFLERDTNPPLWLFVRTRARSWAAPSHHACSPYKGLRSKTLPYANPLFEGYDVHCGILPHRDVMLQFSVKVRLLAFLRLAVAFLI